MKISTRITIVGSIGAALLVIALMIYVSTRAKQIQQATAHGALQEMAFRHAKTVDQNFESSIEVARTFKHSISKMSKIPTNIRREVAIDQMRNLLEKNPDFFCVWTCWEPNAFDGQDNKFANTKGHDATGRFIPKWQRTSNGIELIPLSYYDDTTGEGDFYQLAKQSGKEVILPPYTSNDGGIRQTTLVTPIIQKGKVIGVIGIDISIEHLHDLVNKVTPYSNGYSFLIANDLSIAAHPNKTYQGKAISEFTSSEITEKYKTALANHTSFEYDMASPKTNKNSHYIGAPIQIGDSESNWMFVTSVPDETIMAEVTRFNQISILSGLLALLTFILVSWYIARGVDINVNKVRKEVDALIEAGTNGKLSYRAVEESVHKDFQPILTGFNHVLDTIMQPINTTANYIQRISQGDIPDHITEQYKGDFEVLKNNINTMIDTLNELTTEMNTLYKEQASGNYDYHMDDTPYKGVYQQVAQGYNQTVKLHVDSILQILDIVGQYGEGNFQNLMPDMPGKQIIATKIINGVRANLLNVTQSIQNLSTQVQAGDLSAKANIEGHKGEYANIIKGLNNTLDAITSPLGHLINGLATFMTSILEGDLSARLKMDQLVIDEFAMVANGINEAVEAILQPLDMSVKYISQISQGIIPAVITETYSGDFNKIKDSINALIKTDKQIIDSARKIASGNLNTRLEKRSDGDELIATLQLMTQKLSDIVLRINESSEHVKFGSSEISNSASSMAQGANEQAASVEEVSASIEQMQATINQNSDNAMQTERIALKAATDIEEGSRSVQTTVEAMRTIIEKIQIVADIADKTDLLAINAAIEAARAGEHGEGFAVVAGEVRKLAEMSKLAANEINAVSKSSLKTAEKSGDTLKEIVPLIKNTANLVQEIALASQEQNGGIHQITAAITQLNNLSQQNAASAEELSTGSEELTTQADALRETINYFRVDEKSTFQSHQEVTTKEPQIITNDKDHGINIKLDLDETGFEQF